MGELTKLPEWDEPNGRHLQPWQTSRGIQPATSRQFLAELGACLTLVAPTGMAEDDRVEWLKVARMTLGDVPADLLERGCAVARRTCDHPSKIVPTILGEIGTALAWRKQNFVRESGPPKLAPPPPPEPEYVDPKAIRALINKIGRQDG
jgi:hypothetical protein